MSPVIIALFVSSLFAFGLVVYVAFFIEHEEREERDWHNDQRRRGHVERVDPHLQPGYDEDDDG